MPNLLDEFSLFWRCNNKLNRDWSLSDGKRFLTLYDYTRTHKIWAHLNGRRCCCIDKNQRWTNGRFHAAPFGVSHRQLYLFFVFFFFFLHKKPTWKRMDEECRCGASWVLTSIKPRDNHTHVHMAREIFKTYPFFMYNFYTYIFKYCYKKWLDIDSQRGGEVK